MAQYLSLQVANQIANRVISVNDPFAECSSSILTHQSVDHVGAETDACDDAQPEKPIEEDDHQTTLFLHMEKYPTRYALHVEKTRTHLLDSALRLLGQVGFRQWSMRAAEDAAGVPHGTARHHFHNQKGLVGAMVERLLAIDTPAEGESVQHQVDRWLGNDADFTRARYELMVAAFHDSTLADQLTQARDHLLSVLVDRGYDLSAAHHLGVALDGLVLDALLRRSPAPDTASLQARFVDSGPAARTC